MSANLSLSHLSPHHAGGMQSRPVSQAFCSSEQLHSCWRLSRRWRIGRGGSCDCFRSAVVLQYTGSSSWRNAIALAQSQHGTSQPTSNRRSSRGTSAQTMEREEVLLVADRSAVGSKSQMATVASPPPFPPPRHHFGSPLLWIGLGVGISVFSWAAMKNKNYFPFRPPLLSPSPVDSSMTIASAIPSLPTESKEVVENTEEVKEPALSDANIDLITDEKPSGSRIPSAQLQEETSVQNYFPFPPPPLSTSPADSSMTTDATESAVPLLATESKEAKKTEEVKEPAFSDANIDPLTEGNCSRSKVPSAQSQEETSVQASSKLKVSGVGFGGHSSNGGPSSTSGDGKVESLTTMEMLERMIDGPQIQKMVFPYLPEELRDPVTFKRMIHLPPVKRQLQEALNNVGGEGLFKNMNSDLVKQQFGFTPEEAVGKILANPDIAASLQNSKVVEAIMDCSQNPLNIIKYQNDEEVMNTLLKVAGLFPGAKNFSY